MVVKKTTELHILCKKSIDCSEKSLGVALVLSGVADRREGDSSSLSS